MQIENNKYLVEYLYAESTFLSLPNFLHFFNKRIQCVGLLIIATAILLITTAYFSIIISFCGWRFINVWDWLRAGGRSDKGRG